MQSSTFSVRTPPFVFIPIQGLTLSVPSPSESGLGSLRVRPSPRHSRASSAAVAGVAAADSVSASGDAAQRRAHRRRQRRPRRGPARDARPRTRSDGTQGAAHAISAAHLPKRDADGSFWVFCVFFSLSF
eukprot:5710316-Pleurochrysis_carterae.AAC.3